MPMRSMAITRVAAWRITRQRISRLDRIGSLRLLAMPIMPNSRTPSVAAIAMTRSTIRNVRMTHYMDARARRAAIVIPSAANFVDKPGSRMVRHAT